jgi:hypothetical protein
MSDIQIKTNNIYPFIYWNVQNLITEYGQHTDIISGSSYNGEVDICLHNICLPSSIKSADFSNELQLYPNPILDVLNISSNNPIKDCRIEVYDSYGFLFQVILNKNIENECILDFQKYLTGLYIIKLYYDNKIFTSKVIKK